MRTTLEKILALVKFEWALSLHQLVIRLGITPRAVEKQVARPSCGKMADSHVSAPPRVAIGRILACTSICHPGGFALSWLYLVLAIIFEVVGTTSMKLSQGFTKVLPSVLMFMAYGLSLSALTLALKTIDISVAYAVWSGLGTALIAAVGVLWMREPLTALKVASIVLIIIGVIGLNSSGDVH
jgi:small multidrug resistance pump